MQQQTNENLIENDKTSKLQEMSKQAKQNKPTQEDNNKLMTMIMQSF